jgi:hypothetical protein
VNEIGLPDSTELSGGASLRAWRASQGHEGLKASGAAARDREKRRLAICRLTCEAVAAGAFEVPPRAGHRALDVLLGETAEGREILAEAGRHSARCTRRVPDRPQSVGCECN